MKPRLMNVRIVLALFALWAICLTTAYAEIRQKTIEGKIVELVPSKKEIYVQNNEGKHEFYFTETTSVLEGTQTKAYSDLYEGQDVKVLARVIGKRLDPLSVEIVAK